MTPERRNPGTGAGASDHGSDAKIEETYSPCLAKRQHISTISKNSREELHVFLTEFGDSRFVQFRVTVNDDEHLPIELGYSLAVERLTDLAAAISRATMAAKAKGWLP